MIDDSILLDFGPDTYLHLLQYDLDITELEHCLITHVHKDHLGEEALLYRKRGFANLKEGTKPLTVYGSQDVGDALKPDENGKVTEDGSQSTCRLFQSYRRADCQCHDKPEAQ